MSWSQLTSVALKLVPELVPGMSPLGALHQRLYKQPGEPAAEDDVEHGELLVVAVEHGEGRDRE